MNIRTWIICVLFAQPVFAADEPSVATPEEESAAENRDLAEEHMAAGSQDVPKTMSGMSILGNEEAPKSLVICLLYTSPSPRDGLLSRMPSSA